MKRLVGEAAQLVVAEQEPTFGKAIHDKAISNLELTVIIV